MPIKITRSAELKNNIIQTTKKKAFGRQNLGKIPYRMHLELEIHY
jgi:hypothetical protein